MKINRQKHGLFVMSYLKFRKKTILHILNNVYDKMHLVVLSIVGLWPYQSKNARRIAYYSFLTSSFITVGVLIAGLTDTWSTEPLIILETILATLYVIVGLIKGSIMYIQENKIKKVYDMMKTDWKEITDKEEIKILKAFYQEGHVLVFLFLLYAVPMSFIFGGLHFLPGLLNISSITEYNHVSPYYYSGVVISESARYQQIIVHSAITYIHSSSLYLGICCAFISSVKHVCGIFGIISYRLKNLSQCTQELTLYRKEVNRNIKLKLINIVKKHRDAIRGVYMIDDIFSRGFLILQILAYFLMALLMVNVLSRGNDLSDLFRVLLIFGEFTFYVFLLNFASQEVIQVSNDIKAAAYSVDWYLMSIEVRQLLRMIIMRSCKTEKLTAGSIFTLSIVNFATFFKTCWSAATVLISQKK